MAWCLCGARPMPEPIYPVLSFIDLGQDQMVGFVLLCVCVCIFCEFSFLFFFFFLFNFFDFLDLVFNPLLCAIVYVLMFLCAATMMIS